jgi:hypothetical protein
MSIAPATRSHTNGSQAVRTRTPGRDSRDHSARAETARGLPSDARVKAYALLGDRERAVSIMERRLRA